MRSSPRLLSLAALAVALLAPGIAVAQPADGSAPATDADGDGVMTATNPVMYGVGFRLRNVRIPKGELELFVERAGGGASHLGLGLDFIRRRGNLELQLGFEYEKLNPGSGVWIASGDNVPASQADWMLAPEDTKSGESLGWFTIEFTFLNHTPINKQFAIRYGGGAGLGIITGGLYRYDMICAAGATNANPEPGCKPMRFNGTGSYAQGSEVEVKYDLPPVFPVVNAILGVQYRPTPSVTINLEGGIRTLLFFGLSGAYFF